MVGIDPTRKLKFGWKIAPPPPCVYELDVLCLIPKWYITKWKWAAGSVEGLGVAWPGFLEFLYVLHYDVVQRAVAVAYLAHHQPHAQILLLVQLPHSLAVVFDVRILRHLSKPARLCFSLYRWSARIRNSDCQCYSKRQYRNGKLWCNYQNIHTLVHSRRHMKCWQNSRQNNLFLQLPVHQYKSIFILPTEKICS